MAHAQGRKGQGRKIAGLRGSSATRTVTGKRSIERFFTSAQLPVAGRALQSQSLSSAEWVESLRSLNLLGERSPGEDVLLVVKSEAGPDRVVQLSELVRRASRASARTRPSCGRVTRRTRHRRCDRTVLPRRTSRQGARHFGGRVAEPVRMRGICFASKPATSSTCGLQCNSMRRTNPPAGLAEVLSAVHELFQDEDGWASAFWLARLATPRSSPRRHGYNACSAKGPQKLLRLIDRSASSKRRWASEMAGRTKLRSERRCSTRSTNSGPRSKMPLWTTIGSGSKARGGEQ